MNPTVLTHRAAQLFREVESHSPGFPSAASKLRSRCARTPAPLLLSGLLVANAGDVARAKRYIRRLTTMLTTTITVFAVFAGPVGALSEVTAHQPAISLHELTLRDQHDKLHSLETLANAEAVVIFTHGIGCPIVRHMAHDFQGVAREFGQQEVIFLMVNANIQDDAERIKKDAGEYAIGLPILKDSSQELARSLGLTRTAETVVIDPSDWEVVYRGPVNDRVDYETVKQRAESDYLAEALHEYLRGEPISQPEVRFVGCAISY